MSWFRVDDKLHAHRKARRAGAAAMGLWVMCGSYASAMGDTGRLETDEVEAVAATIRLKKWQDAAEKLIEVGLWDRDGDSFVFHDWQDYRPLGEEEAERRRAADRERKREAYAARAHGSFQETSADSPRRKTGDSAPSPETSEENSPHPRVGSPSPVPSRSVSLSHSAGVSEDRRPPRTPQGAKALEALGQHPALALAADADFAEELAAAAEMAGKQPLVPEAIADAAAQVTAREAQHDRGKVRETLIRFVRAARSRAAGSSGSGGAGGSGRRSTGHQAHPDRSEAPWLEKALAGEPTS